jgi:NADH dehydrogenase/NADH:ubiquinone oxidoreductase subunit G
MREVTDRTANLFDDLEDELPTDQVAEAPVPEEEVQPVPDAEPAPVPETSTAFDLSSADSVREAAEKAEALKNYLEKVKLDTANAERQRIQNEMRREQGSVERAQAYHQWLIDQIENGADPEELKKQTPLYVTANAGWAQAQVLRELAGQAIEMASPEVKATLQQSLDDADSPEAVQRIASRVIQAVVDKNSADVLSNLDFNNLQEHPRFSEWLTSQVKARMEEEMKAQETQSKSRPQAPAVPSGTASTGGISAEQFVSMDKAAQDKYLSNLTEEQEDALMTALYEAARGG